MVYIVKFIFSLNKMGDNTLYEFLLTVPHHMDVFNANELEPNVAVVVLIFIAFARSSVRHCI